MPPLRILHVVPYYEHAWAYGGIPRVATTLTPGLARRGDRVAVLATDAGSATTRATAASTTVAGPGRLDVHAFRNLSNTLAFHAQVFTPLGLTRYLRGGLGGIDIAHLHACRNWPIAAAARALATAGVPYVVSP